MANSNCGWCSTGHHDTCRVAFVSNGRVIVCGCPCDKNDATPIGPVPENYQQLAAEQPVHIEPEATPRRKRRKKAA